MIQADDKLLVRRVVELGRVRAIDQTAPLWRAEPGHRPARQRLVGEGRCREDQGGEQCEPVNGHDGLLARAAPACHTPGPGVDAIPRESRRDGAICETRFAPSTLWRYEFRTKMNACP